MDKLNAFLDRAVTLFTADKAITCDLRCYLAASGFSLMGSDQVNKIWLKHSVNGVVGTYDVKNVDLLIAKLIDYLHSVKSFGKNILLSDLSYFEIYEKSIGEIVEQETNEFSDSLFLSPDDLLYYDVKAFFYGTLENRLVDSDFKSFVVMLASNGIRYVVEHGLIDDFETEPDVIDFFERHSKMILNKFNIQKQELTDLDKVNLGKVAFVSECIPIVESFIQLLDSRKTDLAIGKQFI
ncbi:hypothetical protein EQG49_13345 [Periweissella cryptocerci]|uniref:Uncharacterized protein n=1 Tax=Periweissella cryptocerci TaxID=2506420 RepID=A0A4P6YWX8_9LACO|nr:hypothetical protein [Periweissella cryptocerci]QBO37382.1 hypothetical protein EQG49_13345 [Periweissella cryptocerci]